MSDFFKALGIGLGVLVVGGVTHAVVTESQRRQREQGMQRWLSKLYTEIIDELDLHDAAPPFIFDERVPNAASVNGRLIVVNLPWAVEVDDRLRATHGVRERRAAWLIVLLHELGHHLNQHSTPAIGAWCDTFAPRCEWSADEFAARNAVRMGVSPEEAHAVLAALGDGCSLSHGCSRDRVARIVEIIYSASNPFLAYLPAYNGLPTSGFPPLG